jgi:hypothetical protein
MPKLIQTPGATRQRNVLSYRTELAAHFHKDGPNGPVTFDIALGHDVRGNGYTVSLTQAEALELIRRLTQMEVRTEFFPEKATLAGTNDSEHQQADCRTEQKDGRQ